MPAATEKANAEYAMLPGKDGDGNPVFSVLVVRTYDFIAGQPLARAEKDRKIRKIDEYWDMGDAQSSTVRFESDTVPYKAKTDVVFVGKARTPAGKPMRQMDTGIQVEGAGSKVIRIIGNRKCVFQPGRPPLFTEPEPFTEMEIRYDNAYGGEDKLSIPGLVFSYPRNFRGKGLAIRNSKEVVDGLDLPNLENPNDLITPERLILNAPDAWPHMPMPQGFGWFPRTCYPRSFFAGVLPPYIAPGTLTAEEYFGILPKDHVALAKKLKIPSFDPRFNTGASPGMAFPLLRGNETIRMGGLFAEGVVHFILPGEKPALSIDIGNGEQELEPVLHSVCIRGDDRQVDLVWCGYQPYPGVDWLAEMTTLVVKAD